MKSYLFFGFLVFFAFISLSSENGVPQPVSGAPGDASGSCKNCHNNVGSYTTTLALTLLNKDSVEVNQYVPGESYKVKLKVSGTNNPKSYGFQMVSLAGSSNLNAGTWSNFGTKVKSLTLKVSGNNRNYLVQSSPKTDGLFEAVWKAPATDLGNVTFYFAGLAVNLNGRDSGDNHTTGSKIIKSSLTATSDQTTGTASSIWPNPATDVINVAEDLPSTFIIYDECGRQAHSGHVFNQQISVTELQKGNYYLTILNPLGRKSYSFLKL